MIPKGEQQGQGNGKRSAREGWEQGTAAWETNKGLKRSACVDPFKSSDVNLGRHGFLYIQEAFVEPN